MGLSRAIRELTVTAQRRLTSRADEITYRRQRLRWPVTSCAVVGALLILVVIGSVSAQQSPEAQPGGQLPMILSPTPRSPGANASPPPSTELPATLPAIPSGVAIPPSDAQEQRPPGQPAPSLGTAVPPLTTPPLPKTTPLPPPAVATSPVPPAQSAQPTQAVTAPPPRSSQAPTPAPLPEQRIFPPPARAQTLPAPYPILIGAAETAQQMIRLADMGRPDGVRLEGTSTQGSVTFSTRQDDTFTSARISSLSA